MSSFRTNVRFCSNRQGAGHYDSSDVFHSYFCGLFFSWSCHSRDWSLYFLHIMSRT